MEKRLQPESISQLVQPSLIEIDTKHTQLLPTPKRCVYRGNRSSVELHLSKLIWTVNHPDIQKIRKI
jgi:hypothetical protein